MTSEERALDPQARLQDALDAAYRHLSRRERTEAELRRHLEHRRVEPSTIEEALAALREQGYADDIGYARRFAEDRRKLDGWGADRIERRLATLGVAPEHISAAISAQDADGELAAALSVLEQRLAAAPADDRERGKALGLLVRRGYDLTIAHDAIRAFERGRQAA